MLEMNIVFVRLNSVTHYKIYKKPQLRRFFSFARGTAGSVLCTSGYDLQFEFKYSMNVPLIFIKRPVILLV